MVRAACLLLESHGLGHCSKVALTSVLFFIRDPSKMETFQELEYSKSAYQKHLEDEELGVSVSALYVCIQANSVISGNLKRLTAYCCFALSSQLKKARMTWSWMLSGRGQTTTVSISTQNQWLLWADTRWTASSCPLTCFRMAELLSLRPKRYQPWPVLNSIGTRSSICRLTNICAYVL